MPGRGLAPLASQFLCTYVGARSGIVCGAPPVVGSSHCEQHGGRVDGKAARARGRVAGRLADKTQEILIRSGFDLDGDTDEARELMDILETPRAVDPGDAILEEVHRTAGVVRWLEAKIASLSDEGDESVPGFVGPRTRKVEESGFTSLGSTGSTREETTLEVTHWWTILEREREHLVKACTAALRSGIEERRVRIAERGLDTIEAAMGAALAELGLDPFDARVRAVLGTHLRRAIEGGTLDGNAVPFVTSSERAHAEVPRDDLPGQGTGKGRTVDDSSTPQASPAEGPQPVDF